MAASTYEPSIGRTGLLVPGQTRVSDSALSSGPLNNVASYLTLLFVVLLVGRVPEITMLYVGSSFYQILVLNAVLAAFLILTGALIKVGATRGGTLLIAFHLWIMLTLPFSGYRRGSVEAFVALLTIMPCVFFIGGFLSRNGDTLRKGLWAMALAGVVAILFIQYNGVQSEADEDRYMAQGSFGNSNMVAIYLLAMVPFWSWIVMNKRNSLVVRLLFGAIIIDALSVVIKTGSRSGFLTILLLGTILFFAVGWADKAKILVVGSVLAFLGIGMMSDSLKARIRTIVHSDAVDVAAAEGKASSEARYALLIDSIEVTVRHPVAGSGLGVYSAVSARDKEKQGQRGLWQVSHNLYTQISSELGFPGLFLYLGILGWSVRALLRVRKAARQYPETRDMSAMAATLLCVWVVFCFNGLFMSMALEFIFYVLVGFSIAAHLAYQGVLLSRSQNQNSRRTVGPARSSRFFPTLAPAPVLATGPSVLPAPAAVETVSARTGRSPSSAVLAEAARNAAPWKRNPRKYPPPSGTPSR